MKKQRTAAWHLLFYMRVQLILKYIRYSILRIAPTVYKWFLHRFWLRHRWPNLTSSWPLWWHWPLHDLCTRWPQCCTLIGQLLVVGGVRECMGLACTVGLWLRFAFMSGYKCSLWPCWAKHLLPVFILCNKTDAYNRLLLTWSIHSIHLFQPA